MSTSATSSSSDSSVPSSQRPDYSLRKHSSSIIVPRDCPNIEINDEVFEEGDPRTMSPRRSSEEVLRVGEEARRSLIEQAKILQANLSEILERVETLRNEHDKLEGGNRFLQSYIGELMLTGKITSADPPKITK